ncbi:hypothetical protein PanWU01x14_257450 [Parasponia andersonii]|uniref:Uncharacterized protein n=1 Tax=Parasponia andersonii TaxID=3476 RepID=A0A2P5BA20_PARAD|nr:hypothetical protein PanWU01x14_257450 [Parasponia andersonii]
MQYNEHTVLNKHDQTEAVNKSQMHVETDLQVQDQLKSAIDQGGAVIEQQQEDSDIDVTQSGPRSSLEPDVHSESETDEIVEVVDNLRDYTLSRDVTRRQIKPSTRYAQDELMASALNVADTIELEKLTSYIEARKSKDWV